MSDSPALANNARRQPPSPLIFSPDTVLSPQVPTTTNNNAASSSNTVSMPFVRRHVTRRLKAAKADCDKELQRVTNSITAFFEERLREGDYDTERDVRDRELVRELGRELGQEFGGRERGRGREDSRSASSIALDGGETTALRDPFVLQERTSMADESGSDGGYEAEAEYMPHSRQPSSSASMSPGSLRRHQSNNWDRHPSISPSASTITLPDAPMTRKPPAAAAPGAPAGWAASASSRRLSRSIHIATRPSPSEQSSRSTSRSRSPLPPLSTHASFSDFGSSNNRRSSRILLDDPIDPIMTALYDLIGVATEIIDMSVAQLTAQPKVCESLVQRVQNIGKAWDDHPDWHGRNWYVQVLLAVASLSRVVEWWEAEKQFWNFDDNDNEQDEPLTFVSKYDESQHVPTPTVTKSHEADLEGFSLDLNDENKLRLHRPQSQNRRSRDEQPKELAISAAPPQRESPGLMPPGVPRMVSTSTASKILGNTESARVLATERLRLQAETAQNQNIVLELSLDGDHFLWVNYAWSGVVGTDPDELTGTRISRLLAPPDHEVFRDATAQLQEDESKTVEVRFRLQVESGEDLPGSGALYQQMEGKGMLMIDREDGRPSHTMWVIHPIAPPRHETDAPLALDPGDLAPEPASSVAATFTETERTVEPESAFPFSQPISVDPILCRICEAQIPQWYFEKHSETCAETHRLEAEISECNESISELRSTIKELCAGMDRSSPAPSPPEYRGIPIYTPSSSPIMSSPLQLFRMNKMQRFGVKKMQRRLLDQLDDILQVALEVSIPTLKEDEAREPIERQRLLSPSSERKISQIRHWGKPTVEDAALNQLVGDAERVMRQKMDNVVRMQNTIRYAEKIWHEWEERVGHMLETVDEDSGSDSGESDLQEEELPAGQIDEDQSSTTSEYAYGGETTAEPTPLASSPRDRGSPQRTPPERPNSSLAMPPPAHTSRSLQNTRSSTPSSISSPLALAAPIMAPSSPDLTVPPMDLDNGHGPSNLTIRTRRSTTSLLEPKVVVTPPASPQVGPRDENVTVSRQQSTKQGHRRHSTAHNLTCGGPLSPRQPSAPPLSRTNPTSIKDFDIIKPISKGAFGSVFLAKKKVTGDYYAIKVLKKADMIAKNQITNVKAERMILMKQAESPFVAKLYWTFQSRDNLYLVMEYLNGGDCAALIKSLGCLPEEWTKNYIAEVVLGLEYLHQRGVVHRDLKPDNLLIDQHGHLKLTDFGLSRIGLLGRQTREGAQTGRPNTRYSSRSRPPSIDSAYLSSPLIYADTTPGGSYFAQRPTSVPRIGSSPHLPLTDDMSDSGSDMMGFAGRRYTKAANESPLQSFATELTTDLRSHSSHGGTPPGPGEQKFVGTPDYLAPETILGLRGDDAAVDWWALGVITYEFLYGIPPFHAETPEKLFENILSGHVEWHDDWVDFSPEARDFMERLMTLNPAQRLGANGAEEVRHHPFFDGIEWDKVTTTEAAFIPQVTDPESTDYFDPRGAIPQLFHDDDPVAIAGTSVTNSPALEPSAVGSTHAININREAASSPGSDDFGSFSFKNLPVLKQANDDVIRKLKTDQMAPMHHALSEPTAMHGRKRSLSYRLKKPPSVVTNPDVKMPGSTPILPTNPPSPATSTSSIASSPSRASVPSGVTSSGHVRKPSDLGAVERFKLNHLDNEHRRNSMPSRLRTASVSSAGDNSGSETYTSSLGQSSAANELTYTPASSVHSIDLRKAPDPNDRVVTCLLAEDNPITAKILETLLIRLGCRCFVVADGSEAISVAMGDIKFDVILMDLHMPVLDGESAAKYIKSTNGRNANTPIIAVSAYAPDDTSEGNDVFAAFLAKPLQKADLLSAMRHIGFKTSTLQGGPNATKVMAGRTYTS
ncbi:hypothetical protein BD626DRAFT_479309 [Schizophyllum amplum]|uniref:non-specific serine/threonine protein kinase n=1 Tax=Schizophyllum amplum TaxID=97359 RepID=A0A550CS57_9AGAR|nr:hypothetical protein BD626DRAFT_479309 [Auriculariopsis ampla]